MAALFPAIRLDGLSFGAGRGDMENKTRFSFAEKASVFVTGFWTRRGGGLRSVGFEEGGQPPRIKSPEIPSAMTSKCGKRSDVILVFLAE